MKLRGRKQRKELAAAIAQGRQLRVEGQDEKAFEFLGDAVQRFPRDPEVRCLYAGILLAFRVDDVAREAKKAVELAPDDPAILVRAGHLLINRNEIDAARSCAKRANEVVKPGFVFMSDLEHLDGLLAMLDGDDDLAEEKLRSAVASVPANEPWVRHLAVFLAENGRLSEAVEVLDEGLTHVENKGALESMRGQMAKEVEGQ